MNPCRVFRDWLRHRTAVLSGEPISASPRRVCNPEQIERIFALPDYWHGARLVRVASIDERTPPEEKARHERAINRIDDIMGALTEGAAIADILEYHDWRAAGRSGAAK